MQYRPDVVVEVAVAMGSPGGRSAVVIACWYTANVGVLLLNLVMQRQNLELVYLGLARPWRGKGLGRRLMHQALRLANEHRVAHLVLAVDELNAVALRLYRSLGFVATVRKLALVKPLKKEGTE